MELSEKIRMIREDSRLTQDEMAKRLFVTRQAVSKWERGLGYPSLDTLRLISKEFDISLNDLLDAGKEEKSRAYKPIGYRSYYWAIVYSIGFLITFSILLSFTLISALTENGLDLETDGGVWALVLYIAIIGFFCLFEIACILFCLLPLGKVQIEYNDFGIRIKTLKGSDEIPFEAIVDLTVITTLNLTPGRLIVRTPNKVYKVFALKDLNHVKTVIDEVKVLNRQ